MPIYEYACSACGGEFEVIQKITAEPVKKCDLCGSKKVKKLMSLGSFQLKGSGWYVTDYKGKDSGGGGKKAKASGDTTEKAAAPAADCKADAGGCGADACKPAAKAD